MRNKHYPIADYLPYHLRYPQLPKCESIVAMWTGEKRAPKRGEWYLSGSVIEAYHAPNDLTQPFHIAKLYRAVTKTLVTVEVGAEVQA